MRSRIELSDAESLSGAWAALHNDVEFTISSNEVHYLTTMALAVDDDLVSHLLLKKIRLAATREPISVHASTVRMNSFLEYAFDGGKERFCQLVHPSPHAPSYGVSVASLHGAGVLGLRPGQTILWPDENGTLCDLRIGHVENCPGMSDWLGSRTESPLSC